MRIRKTLLFNHSDILYLKPHENVLFTSDYTGNRIKRNGF